MTLQELLPELHKLTVTDKVEVIKILTHEVAEQSAVFVPGAVYEVWSPYDSAEAAAQLQKMLDAHLGSGQHVSRIRHLLFPGGRGL